jgi:hypothetical protein
LQAGNLSAAQSDFATLQQDTQQQQGAAQIPHHHHHHAESSQTSDASQQNGIASLLSQLGQELQSGNVNLAQQTYTTLQQDFQQFTASPGFTSSDGSSSGSPASGALSVTA